MDPTIMKVPIVEQEKPASGLRDRPMLAMACSVATLAVAFIVLIACGTYALQQDCPATTNTDMVTQKSQPRTTTERDIPVQNNGTTFNEHTIMYVEDQMEFVVSRESKTGFVANVITIDYQKEVTTIYDASMHMCFLGRGLQHSFEEDKNFLDNYKEGENPTGGRDIYIDFDTPVDNPDDIPEQMAPFCTTKNSLWVVEKSKDDIDRQKRATYYCQVTVTMWNGDRYIFWWYSSYSNCPPSCFHCCFAYNNYNTIFGVNGIYCFYHTSSYCTTSMC